MLLAVACVAWGASGCVAGASGVAAVAAARVTLTSASRTRTPTPVAAYASLYSALTGIRSAPYSLPYADACYRMLTHADVCDIWSCSATAEGPKQLGLRGGGDEEAAAAEERVVVAVPPNPCKLFIGNLAPKTEEAELKAFIDSVGAGVLSELIVKRDKRGVCKGFAMATFASPAGISNLGPHILVA